MDFINAFPDKETAFIGLFMIKKSIQGKGIGSRIMEDLPEYLLEIGVKFIRLGWSKENKRAESFWHKNRFKETGVTTDAGEYRIVIAQKDLKIMN